MLDLLVYILEWRGKGKAKKEGRKYGITIGQYITIVIICLAILVLAFRTYMG
ncbi:MAG: hypothetical protein H3C54_12880 [Taibaiella sp.]|nr:hypothetical protein [Taibaiella sp.]